MIGHQDCRVDCGHDFAGLGSDHREAKYAIVLADKRFHKALSLLGGLRSEHRGSSAVSQRE
jgi:hypothetical protein